MINYTIYAKSNQWPRRVKKLKQIINQVLIYRNDLKFICDVNYYCNFILANDIFIKKLNYKYKKLNKSTDVLTFVSNINFKNKKKEKHCDIVLSIDTIKKDVEKNDIEFYNHLTHLIIHSFLHINDYVHNRIKDYIVMKNLEISVLKKLQIKNPY